MGIKIKDYFVQRDNILTFLGLLAICAIGFALRIGNLGYLSFWGDDGHAVIGTLSILEHGYPLLPSGNFLYHGMLSYYFNIIAVLIFGAEEFAFRITSVVFSIMSIIAIYFLGKTIANKFVGFLAAAVLSFSTWYIIFAREARYYQALQFFYVLTFLFFYLGFFKKRRPFRILAAIFMVLTLFIHGIGIMLLVLFIPLFIYLGRKFFKKEVLIPFAAVIVFNALWVINQVFFWQVGRSFYAEDTSFMSMIAAYFKLPDPFYIKRISEMFPEMFALTIAGALLFVIFTAGLSIRKNISFDTFYLNELELKIKRLRIPFNFFLILFVFWIVMVLVSLGRMYNQQRYVYFIMPLFIIIFAYSVFLFSVFLARAIDLLYASSSKERPGIPKRTFHALLVLFFALISIFTVSGIDPVEAIEVADINHRDPIDVRYSISNIWDRHWDAATVGEHIAQNKQEADIVITTDIYNTPPYSGFLDYWLWTGDLASWAPYRKIGDYYFDDTYGVRVIRSITELYEVLNSHKDSNVWVATSYSLYKKEHVDPLIAAFLDSRKHELILTGRDDVSKLYYFPKTDEAFRVTMDEFFAKKEVADIDLETSDLALIDFTDAQSAQSHAFGFSSVEPGIGTWSLDDRSFVLFRAKAGSDYILKMAARPFSVPGKIQELTLIVNGNIVGSYSFYEENDFSTIVFDIPSEYIIETTGYIEFGYSYTASPKDLGQSADIRQLAVLFKEISIEKK